MLRLRPAKPKPALSAKALRYADGIFVLLSVAAFVIGGSTALAGMPRLSVLLALPDASAPPHAGKVALLPLSVSPEGVSKKTLVPTVRPAAIAIVIDDLGQDISGTQKAIDLPRQVALSFLPFGEDTPSLSASAARRGHEVLVHMPMESLGGKDAGPNALTLDLPRAEVERRLAWALGRIPVAVGLNNHEGSRFTSDAEALVPVAQMLKARGLYFFDSRTAVTTQVVSVARSFGVASADREVFLDDTVSSQEVAKQLRALETKAKAQGIVVAIGHPHAVTMGALENWTRDLERRGFALVTLREAIRLKTQRDAALAYRH
jgi:polysaccharide deacetylase 2 family uncharacterized protein YibQ